MTGPVGWKAHFIDRTQLQNAQQMRIWIRKFLNTVRNFILHYINIDRYRYRYMYTYTYRILFELYFYGKSILMCLNLLQLYDKYLNLWSFIIYASNDIRIYYQHQILALDISNDIFFTYLFCFGCLLLRTISEEHLQTVRSSCRKMIQDSLILIQKKY